MGKNSTNKITHKFLTNQPSGEDLFENKSQEKIAKVISEKIINEPEFKIIGIDGEWGSGKSNLVRLVEKKLESTHKFFVYDVWGHQEDEQRKAILVELTDFIQNEKGLLKKGDKKIWDDKLKVLLAKSKETTTINQPYLSVGFIFSLLSIIYIPTVNVFKDSIKDFFEIDSLFWKFVLVTGPILIVIGIFLWNLVKGWFHKKGFCKSFRLSAEETFQVYTNKQKEETKIETISEDQPSVRDFQNWMEDINQDLNKKIVIVFDNFDRLPKKHILNIWSSIHIFFAEKEYSNIKVIIPFDREHVQNAFKELNGTDNKFGDDYVNKTFDIVFRITLPIMSNWKKFFSEQWKKAFINYDEDELRLVIQVYEFLNRRITPREIISFINEILTIKLLDDDFKERYIAIFVLLKDKILADPLKAIINLEYLGGLKSFYSNDPDFAKQLTAIVYHIDVDNALELIYRQKLKDSLIKNDVEHFNTICDSDFIDSIFTSVISEIDVSENPIKTLADLKENSKLSTLHVKQTWHLFYNAIIETKKPITKLKIEDWHVILISKTSDDRYLTYLLNEYAKLVDESNIEHYIDVIDDLGIDLQEDRVLKLLNNKEVNAILFIKLIEYKGGDYKKYKLYTNNNSLDEHLSNLSVEDVLKLNNTQILVENFNLKNYKELLKNYLNRFVNENNIHSADDVMKKLIETSKTNVDLKDLLNDAQIYSLYLNHPSSDLNIVDELIAMRIARGNEFNSSYSPHFQAVLNTDDENRAEQIATRILKYVSYGDLLLKSIYFRDSILFKQIIIKLFSKTDLNKSPNVMSVIQSYKDIKESLSISDSELLKEINNWDLTGTEFDVDELNDEFIIDCFNNHELTISRRYIDQFNSDFKELTEELYDKVFTDNSDVHFRYFDKLNLDSLTQTSLDVFEKKLIDKLRENTLDKNWWNILNIYDSNNSSLSLINSLKNIRDQFLNSSIPLNINIAKKILPYFIKHRLLNGKNEVFRLIIKNDFLSDTDFIEILISNSEYIKTVYQEATQPDKEGFRNVINEKREENSFLEQLAKSLDIRKAKQKPVNNEEVI